MLASEASCAYIACMAELLTRIIPYRDRLVLDPVRDVDLDVLREEQREHEPLRTTLLDYTECDQLRRWYWGLVEKVAAGIGVQKDDLHLRLKLKTAFVRGIAPGPSGPIFLFKSIARGIKPSALRRYVDAAVEVIFIDYLPGVPRGPLLREIDDWVGPRPM